VRVRVSRSTVRRLDRVLGWVSMIRVSSSWIAMFAVKVDFLASKADQRNPRTSPRRIPVIAEITNAG